MEANAVGLSEQTPIEGSVKSVEAIDSILHTLPPYLAVKSRFSYHLVSNNNEGCWSASHSVNEQALTSTG